MTATLAGYRLEVVSPRKAELRPGDDVALEVSLELPEPWIERPRLGREIKDVDGGGLSQGEIAFECDRAMEVPALVSGEARSRDTRIDVHTPRGFPDAGAGRGVEVTIRAGAFEVRYGHLERGSVRTGRVEAGERIGLTGNTGRCVDGCGRTFVAIEIKGPRPRRIDELCQPIDVEVLQEGRRSGPLVRVPSGETEVRRLAVGRIRAPRDGVRPIHLEVRALRGREVVASTELELRIRI